jgi:MinD superfamily P-loop ATPase
MQLPAIGPTLVRLWDNSMKQLVIISGKGGTGKTSLVASFAALAQNKALADCDVDAADLHLILSPSIRTKDVFHGMPKFTVNQGRCIQCGKCVAVCRFGAVTAAHREDGEVMRVDIDPISCEGCGVCAHFCPAEAIHTTPTNSGRWFLSDTRHGPMVHARLGIAEENSGKLVTIVRTEAKRVAHERGMELVIIDGPPGIGCPVIASITGTDLVLIVTEPTLSGRHDLERAAALAGHFGIPVVVCINKHDLNPQIVIQTRDWCRRNGILVVGQIPYDPLFTRAQMAGQSIVEYDDGPTSFAVREAWVRVVQIMEAQDARLRKT